MIKKSPIEQERANIIKVSRTLIRLKHSIAADNEINDVLPARLEEFDKALQHGELKTIEIPATLEEVADANT